MLQDNDSPRWPALIERIRGIARSELYNNTDGVAVVCVDIVVNNLGDPLIWLKPNCRRVEPSADAARVLLHHFTERIRGENSGT